jgi:hypothetical protein
LAEKIRAERLVSTRVFLESVGGRGLEGGLPRDNIKKEIVVVSLGGCGRYVFKVGNH